MMIFIAYISLGFLVFQLVNVLINLIFRQKLGKIMGVQNEAISILIPARNEEENIEVLLNDLRQIENEKIEIIVYDDQSTDHTAKVVNRFSRIDRRVSLLQSEDLPSGWMGKNHASYKLAQQAKGAYLLFVDADVRLNPGLIEDAVAFLKHHELGLLSIFPVQIQKTWGEKITVPVMNYILLSLLPLILVRISPFSSHSAANGQFMLFKSTVYQAIHPHKRFRLTPVEDIAISKYFKSEHIKTACLIGDERVRCRMYKGYKEALAGFSKNIFMFFGGNPMMALLFWAFATLGFLPFLYLGEIHLSIYIFGVVLVQLFCSLLSRQNVLRNTLLFPVQLLFLLRLIINSLYLKITNKHQWKNRPIYS